MLIRIERAGEITDDRVANTIARSRPVKELVDAIWPPLDPVRILMDVLGELRRGYRVPATVIDPAARLLPHVAPEIAPPVAVRCNPGQHVVLVEALPAHLR